MDFRGLRARYDPGTNNLERKLDSLDINGKRAEIRSLLISVGTDLDLAAEEPYGNADQSIIVDSKDRDRARELFAMGGDIQATGRAYAFSSFGMNCIGGDFAYIRFMLEEICDGLPQPLSRQVRLRKLLESRETSLRLSPLLLTVSEGKNYPIREQPKIAKLLLRYGASPDAKDILGKTAVHYGAGAMATPMSMEIAGMCIKAAETSDMYGKSGKLEGLQNAAMNGKIGIVGGFDVDSGRRGIYIPELKKELWVKPKNIRITSKTVEPDPTSNISGREAVLEGLKHEQMNGKEGILGKYDPKQVRRSIYIPELKKQVWAKPENIRLSTNKPRLTDVRDRFGTVSLQEVIMSNRVDVAEFLLTTHKTGIHTKDADGISPMTMTISGGTLLSNEVAKMITTVARAEAATERNEAKKAKSSQKGAIKNVCASCNKSLGTGGMSCSKCTVTYYCDRECQVKDWKEGGHKQKCKKIAVQKFGVKLCTKHCEGSMFTFASISSLNTGTPTRQSSADNFCKPRGVLFDEKFVVKVQANGASAPLMIYDETRQCQFGYKPTGPGFHEVLEAVQKEPTWDGRKTFMKASFDKEGKCTMYPATAAVKNKYSW